MVYRERGSTRRGLTLFAMATASDPKTESFRFAYVGGVYQGIFPRRDADFIAFVFAYGRYNSRLTRFAEDRDSIGGAPAPIQRNENLLELDYGIQVTPWLNLRPNLQYVIHPGGSGTIANALVIGLFTRVTF
jgi:porin